MISLKKKIKNDNDKKYFLINVFYNHFKSSKKYIPKIVTIFQENTHVYCLP